MYIADTSNNRIQKFTASTGAFLGWAGGIATVGGTCTAGVGAFTGKWCSGGTGGSGTADGLLNGPRQIALDTNGVIYIPDSINGRIDRYKRSP